MIEQHEPTKPVKPGMMNSGAQEVVPAPVTNPVVSHEWGNDQEVLPTGK
jgi:hypothetical protein